MVASEGRPRAGWAIQQQTAAQLVAPQMLIGLSHAAQVRDLVVLIFR